MRRGSRRQQHFRAANTVLHRSGNLLQRLDAGQHAHVGLGRTGDESDKQGKESGHGDYSARQKQVT
jgi:hypothetical protein